MFSPLIKIKMGQIIKHFSSLADKGEIVNHNPSTPFCPLKGGITQFSKECYFFITKDKFGQRVGCYLTPENDYIGSRPVYTITEEKINGMLMGYIIERKCLRGTDYFAEKMDFHLCRKAINEFPEYANWKRSLTDLGGKEYFEMGNYVVDLYVAQDDLTVKNKFQVRENNIYDIIESNLQESGLSLRNLYGVAIESLMQNRKKEQLAVQGKNLTQDE